MSLFAKADWPCPEETRNRSPEIWGPLSRPDHGIVNVSEVIEAFKGTCPCRSEVLDARSVSRRSWHDKQADLAYTQ